MAIPQPIIVAVMLAVLITPTANLWAAVFDQDTGAQWLIHLAQPGPDKPKAGRSLFDKLYASNENKPHAYTIPFPFDALVDDLKGLVTAEKGKSVVELLIPKGRSLQRDAAAPQYFHNPRRLLTVVANPSSHHKDSDFALKYRIFIAYQKAINQLEVISYNEEAARFEFQVVHNYASSQVADVSQASRTLCMSCHQNGGPIFSLSPWDETNFNPEVAIEIAKSRPEKYSSFLEAMSTDVARFDIATNDANYFSGLQMVWQSGCSGVKSSTNQSARCRGGLLKALLQHRLSGDLTFDEMDNSFQHNVVNFVSTNWNKKWPNGLLIPTADIPDRNPFEAVDDPSIDPLMPRAPRARWQQPDNRFFAQLVRRLSSFLTRSDISRLDAQLATLSETNSIEPLVLKQQCGISKTKTDEIQSSYQLNCNSNELEISLRFSRSNNGVTSSGIEAIRVPKQGLIWQTKLDHPSLELDDGKTVFRANVINQSEGSARFSSGNRLHKIAFLWDEDQIRSGSNEINAEVKVFIKNDFRLIEQAIAEMTAGAVTGATDALGPLPFRRIPILQALLH